VAGIEPQGAPDVTPDLESVLRALGEHYDYNV